jgi:hypothetical protein
MSTDLVEFDDPEFDLCTEYDKSEIDIPLIKWKMEVTIGCKRKRIENDSKDFIISASLEEYDMIDDIARDLKRRKLARNTKGVFRPPPHQCFPCMLCSNQTTGEYIYHPCTIKYRPWNTYICSACPNNLLRKPMITPEHLFEPATWRAWIQIRSSYMSWLPEEVLSDVISLLLLK